MRMKNDGADSVKYAHKLIARAHAKGALAMTTIGTSQEGADEATIRGKRHTYRRMAMPLLR